MKAILALLFIVLINVAFADVYMHNPRGSNNRNCERNDNRNNNNRLFDSQNNAAGGYACPRAVGGPDVITKTMYYYGGSKLQIEWTNQHSCGQENNNCEIILQYMCENDQPGIRDGTPSDINDSATDGLTVSNKDDARTGQHETYEYYRRCQTRQRNGALYLGATQLATTASATQTRQNPNGGKSGWECPEERDYYPYFHPTPWRDIAVLTTNISRCAYYKANSENVVGRGECWSQDFTSYLPWNNPNECLLNNGVWNTTQPNGDPAPDCVQAPWSRDNHLGNGANGYQNNYIWTIPNINRNTCVLRLRYNISTAETPWTADKKNNAAPLTKQDAVIDSGYGHPLQYAMNNNQYGRTFEDRSYVFSIRPRPTEISPQSTIWNLNVRGKRGNIVDTFPSTEYDFVPQVLVVNGDDYIHFQWTGSDYNPNRQPNNGEGGPRDPADGASARADRSNLVQMSLSAQNVPRKLSDQTMFVYDNGTQNDDIAKLLALLDQPGLTSTDPNVMCLNYTTLLAKNNNNANSAKLDSQNCMKLGNAPTPYFDAGLVKMHATGRFAYVCTRNNNFSNRSQKGLIIVGGAKFSNSPRNGSSLLLVAIVFIASLLF